MTTNLTTAQLDVPRIEKQDGAEEKRLYVSETVWTSPGKPRPSERPKVSIKLSFEKPLIKTADKNR